VVTAARAPIGVAMRWRKRHPCPRHHDEHGGQDKGTGQEQGRAGEKSVPYRADTHGLSRLLTVSRNRSSTASSCACHVVPKLTINRRCRCLWQASAPGWPRAGPEGGGSPAARVSRRVGSEGVADQGQGSMSFSRAGAPHGPLPLARSKPSPPTRRDTRFPPPHVLRQRHTTVPSDLGSCPLRALWVPNSSSTAVTCGIARR
jgi:hypothetical protein